jgi:hypothetical protein
MNKYFLYIILLLTTMYVRAQNSSPYVLNLEDFGAVYDDNLSDQDAFEQAIDSAYSIKDFKPIIKLATGTLLLESKLILNAQNITITGDGIENSLLVWTQGNGGIEAILDKSSNVSKPIEIKDLSIISGGQGTGIGLNVGRLNTPFISFILTNVKIGVLDGLSYWNKNATITLAPLAKISNCEFIGRYGYTEHLLKFDDFSVASTLSNCIFNGADIGVLVEGKGEGYILNNNTISNVDFGIIRRLEKTVSNASEPLMHLIENIVTASKTCLDIEGLSSSSISSNVLTLDNRLNTQKYGIYINGSINIERGLSIFNNTIINQGIQSEAVAIWTNALDGPISIQKNTFNNFYSGISINSNLNRDIVLGQNKLINNGIQDCVSLYQIDSNSTNVSISDDCIRPLNCFNESSCQVPISNISASSTEPGYAPENVLDCDIDTEWKSVGIGENLIFELEQEALLTSVEMAFWLCNERTYDFEIQTSLDGTTYSTSGIYTSSKIEYESFSFPEVNAKYVRIIGNGNSDNNLNQYTGIRVYANGDSGNCQVGLNCFDEIVCQIPVTSISASNTEPGFVPEAVLDCDSQSEWRKQGIGEYLTFELEKQELITSIEIAFWNGNARISYFDVETSTDGISYTSNSSFTSSGTTSNYESFSLIESNTNFIRIIGNGNNINDWNQYTGVRLYSDDKNSSCPLSLNCFDDSSCQVPILEISASNTTAGYNPEAVLDCDLQTEWRVLGIGEQLTLQLEDLQLITSIEIAFFAGNARTADFEVETSLDGVSYNSNGNFTSSGSTLDYESFQLPNIKAKYIRIIGNGNSNSNWNQYTGIRLYSDSKNGDCLPSVNCFDEVACQVPVASISASGTTTGFEPQSVLDCDVQTEWKVLGAGEFLTFELNQLELLDNIEIAFFEGNLKTYAFEIQTSFDGTKYSSSGNFTSSGLTSDYESFTFTEVNANYLRIVGNGNSDSNWNQYTGVRLYADGNNSSCPTSLNCFDESLCQVSVKSVAASNTEIGYQPEDVLDCDSQTEWRALGLGEHLTFELKQQKLLTSIDIAFWNGNNRTAFFEVQTSMDGINYNSSGSFISSGNTSDYEPFLFLAVNANYVRIIGNGNSNNNWNQYTGVRLYANGDDSNCPTNLNCFSESKCQIPVTSISASAFSPGFQPESVLDCDLKTEWRASGIGQHITFELKQQKLLSSVEIAFFAGNSRTYDLEIQTSLNGTSFTSIGSFTSSGETLDYESFQFSGINSKYIRIVGNGNSNNNFNQYTGVRLYADGDRGNCAPSLNCFDESSCQVPVTGIFASNTEPGYNPESVLDCNSQSEWRVLGVGESITFELSEEELLSSVEIEFWNGNARIAYFEIQTSLDGTTYNSIDSFTSSGTTLNYESFSFPEVNAKYVRIIGNGNNNSNWNQFTGVRLYANDNNSSCAPTLNCFKDSNCQVSVVNISASNTESGYDPQAVLDCDLESEWRILGVGEYLTFELKKQELLSSIEIAFFAGESRTYDLEIQTSLDGFIYTSSGIFTSSGSSSALELFSFLPVNSKYLRIIGNGNSDNNWNQYKTIRLYANGSNGSCSDSLNCFDESTCQIPISNIVASNTEPGYHPFALLDCDTQTEWRVNGVGEYLTLELSEEELLSSIEIAFWNGNARTSSFEILTSLDGITYTSLGNFISGGTTLDYESFTFPEVNANNLRIICNGNSNSDWNQYTGVRLYSNGDTGISCPLSINCFDLGSCQVPITAISASSTTFGYEPLGLLDCDYQTEWKALGVGEYLTFELEQLELLTSIEIAFKNGVSRSYNFELLTSLDGINYRSNGNFTSNETFSDYESFSFPAVITNYVRIIGNGNSLNNWNQYTEVRLYADGDNFICQPNLNCFEDSGCQVPVIIISASSTDAGHQPADVLDCDLQTEWSSTGIGEYLTFEMYEQKSLTSIEIAFTDGDIRTYNFEIQTSFDGITYTSSGNFISKGNTTDYESFVFETSYAKYLRVIGNGNSDNSLNLYKGVRLYENNLNSNCQIGLNCFDEINCQIPVTNISASSTTSGYTPLAVLDCDSQTEWRVFGIDEYLTFELYKEKSLTSVEIAFWNGDVRTSHFHVETSIYGVDYTSVGCFTSSGNTSGYESFQLPATKAKYLRIIGKGNSISNWNQYTGVRLYANGDNSSICMNSKVLKVLEVVNNDKTPNLKISIYPNPILNDNLIIHFSEYIKKDKIIILLYDIKGQLILEREVQILSDKINLNLPYLTQGLYLLKIGVKTKKLIKL